ncbi:MAG TPA: hypothetical protein VM490_03605, partial [Armatimonadaceae bacterium]|nr:hypothetical protein [Armatimonadaceae bacterium]
MDTIPITRRTFMKTTIAAAAAAGTAVRLSDEAAAAAAADTPATTLHWLGGAPPKEIAAGVTLGVPWPRGAVRPGQAFALRTPGGDPVSVQTWPLATWPDGSLKWTAHALGPADAPPASYRLEPVAAAAAAPSPALSVRESADAFEVDTGVVRCRVPRKGAALIASITRGDREIARDARLVCLRQDRPDLDAEAGTVRQESFTGETTRATLEQRGPLRAVVRLDGVHKGPAGRGWLPFTVRLYFHAGGDAVRVVHSFVFDGDESRDFIRGLGLRVRVPMRDALHDRHVRFAGEGDGLFAEAVRGLTGLRRDPGPDARAAQVAGRATPSAGQFPDAVRTRLDLIPAWGDFTLSQVAADAFQIRKRTQAGHGWVHAAAGGRASGLGYVGGPSGGLAFGLRDFWQRHPTRLDVRDAASDLADVTLWLWSPDAPAMDLRFYHDGMGMETHPEELQGLEVTYEDYEKGWGTPHGVARTSEMTLWALDATPARERTVALAEAVRNPPVLVCRPERLHAAGVFGPLWAPADRSTPARKAIEEQLDHLLGLYKGQIEQRRWYGFWDFGDVMHSYDPDRHEWRYDVGGFAWANSELSPDLWLWYSFLRTGRADVYRMAEAMTRHTGEVDVHHLGRFKGFGSRHNVQHWGDSSKQPRVSTAAYRRIFYYLTADERAGDLMRE